VEVIENRREAALWRKLGVTVRDSDEEVCTLHLHREVNPSTRLEQTKTLLRILNYNKTINFCFPRHSTTSNSTTIYSYYYTTQSTFNSTTQHHTTAHHNNVHPSSPFRSPDQHPFRRRFYRVFQRLFIRKRQLRHVRFLRQFRHRQRAWQQGRSHPVLFLRVRRLPLRFGGAMSAVWALPVLGLRAV
jgi:hypothetical protein